MDSNSTFNDRQRTVYDRQRAMDDIARMFSGELTPDEAEDIHARRKDNPQLDKDIEGTLQALAVMEGLADRPEYADIKPHRKKPVFTPMRMVAMAASILVVVSVALVAYLTLNTAKPSGDISRYVTRIGEQRIIQLADGSAIELNTGSEIVVEMAATYRRVALERGEAFFSVSKDASRPFSVSVDNQAVSVLGTEFNILKTPETFTLAVLDGTVAVHKKEELVDPSSPDVLPIEGQSVSIKSPGQRLVSAGMAVEYEIYKDRILAYAMKSPEDVIQWRKGILRYDGQSLSRVVQELNRYTGKKILIEDASIMDMEIYATFRIDGINMALNDMEKILPLKVVRHFDRIVLSKKDLSKKVDEE